MRVRRKHGIRGRKSRKVRSNKLTRHHRKPQNLGGGNSTRNISHVRQRKHQAWHILFNGFSAETIFNLFVEYWNSFGEKISSNDKKKIISSNINERAWAMLFANKSIDQILDEINAIWLDPDYRIGTSTVKFVYLLKV